MGDLLGNAVRFGAGNEVTAAGEGIETVLSLRSVLPARKTFPQPRSGCVSLKLSMA